VTFHVLPGAEPWSSNGSGERSRIGILLAHGFTGSPASLRPLAELLAQRGFAIELVRLPGHGTHFRDMMSTRYEDWRGEVSDGLSRLAGRTQRVVALGLSMGGTLVLDGVERLAESLQGKLLRVLQERQVEPLGAEQSVPVDVRILATSSSPLAERMRTRKFREDLYYRLAVVRLELPPLRRRATASAASTPPSR
jgi:sigma54-dependent transcription regulator